MSRSPMRFVVGIRASLAVISRSRIRRLALVEAGVEVRCWGGGVVGWWGDARGGLRGGMWEMCGLREMRIWTVMSYEQALLQAEWQALF